MIARRNFIKKVGLATVALQPLVSGFHEKKAQNGVGVGPTINKIRIFNSSGSFYRFIGMNAYDEKPKGINGNRKSFLLELSDGTIGIGTVGYSRIDEGVLSTIRQLIGSEVFSCYQWNGDQITGVYPDFQKYFYDAKFSWIESGILDTIGKLRGVPVWKLIGEEVRYGIDPYDGTMYFEDIANNTGVDIISNIGKRIKADGYRAIKIKLGRPDKWLPGEEGVNRDIEAVIALREAVGNNFNIMADANNGYRDKFDWSVKLLRSCAPYKMYFMEELFPDDTNAYIRLREILMEDNLYVPIAEGENIRGMDKFDAYLEDGIYSYIQPDIATCGFSNILRAANKTITYPQAQLIPHVWQSQMGLIMSLHLSKIHNNIPFVEDSRYQEHIFDTSGYTFNGGQWFIPDSPGWGISINPDYRQFISGEEIVIS